VSFIVNPSRPRCTPTRGTARKLWQALTTLREHRGDGHIAALVAHRIDPAQSHVLKAGSGEIGLRDAALHPAVERAGVVGGQGIVGGTGLLTGDGTLSPAGIALRTDIEPTTDALALGPYRALGEDGTRRLAGLLRPLADAVVHSGFVPVPNPMGVVWPPDEL
jgi:hypothetical protein